MTHRSKRNELRKAFAGALISALVACPATLFGQSGRPFELLVVGDSLIWGQGLQEKDKTFTHVANWLRDGAFGRALRVDVKVKAHSGSTLKFHPDEAEAFSRAGRDEGIYYKPEVNISFPSTWKQIEVAAAEYRSSGKSGADLIILSGCITDITVAKVLDPNGDNDLLRQLAKKYCHDDMLDVLEHAARLHPETAIAVVGYFPMISPKSNGTRLFNSWLEARGTTRALKWMMNNPLMRKLYFQKVGDNAIARSRLWLEESSKNIQSAVDDFNRKYDRSRAIFVRSPITEENSVEAPNTLLFKMGKKGIPEDPVFPERKADCDAALPELKRSTGLVYPVRFCEVAGVGHPNPTGARAYADAVISALPTVLSRSQAGQ
jgi:hypothetical protein